jgi:hypothetical protein
METAAAEFREIRKPQRGIGKAVFIRGTDEWDVWLEGLRARTGCETLVELYAAGAQALAKACGYEPSPPRTRRG